MIGLSTESLEALNATAGVLEEAAKTHLKAASASREEREVLLARELQIQEDKRKVEDRLEKERRAARLLYDQARTLRVQTQTLATLNPNPWAEKAHDLLRGHGLIHAFSVVNSSTSPKLLSFDLIPAGEAVKIATIIAHDESVGVSEEGEVLFSVAGYRTENGSPNKPFAGLEAALLAAVKMERVHSNSGLGTAALDLISKLGRG